MVQDRFGVWSPHRDSNSIRAFKAALSLRSEPWRWYDDRQQASWWVIDGTQTTLGSLNSALEQQKKNGTVQTVVLAPSWSHIEDPVWTFFKVPLNIKLVYGWIDRCLQPYLPPPAPLARQHFKLKRWPNLTHYTADSSPADAVHLTLACARLLENWRSYDEILAVAHNAVLLDRLLSDARRDGILETGSPVLACGSTPAPGFLKTKILDKPDAWSLVKRLLSKFT